MRASHHRPRCSSVAIAIALLWIGVACEEPAPVDAAPIRLSDLLDVATIDSPVLGVSGAQGLEQLGAVRRQVMLAEDFESFTFEGAGWPASERDGVVDVEGGRAYHHRGQPQQDSRRWILAAQPNRHYVFERRVRSDTALAADFAVLEGTDPQTILSRWSGPFALGQGGAVKIHWPQTPSPDGTWQRGSVSFFTTPQTRALCVVLRATSEGRGERIRWGAQQSADAEARFDDLQLARLAPTAEQKIALLVAQDHAEGADHQLGIEKHGQFAPLVDPGVAHRPEDDNFSFRYALYAPPPTVLSFPVRIPRHASLRFSCCLSRQTRPGHAALFEVLVRSDHGEEALFSRTLTAAGAQWRWHDENVDLGRFAGRSVQLVLRTQATIGRPHALWGNPVVDVRPDESRARNVILLAIDTLRADRLSCYGYQKKTTPHLDALAADGVRFEHVVANANWTCPSFASIFTGVVPARHGVWASAPVIPLPATFDTLAERFRAHGWATHSIAYKAVMYSGGYEQGFDVAFNVPRGSTRADDNLAEAMEWLEANADRRNFLFLHFDDPHQPCNQPAPFDRIFGADPQGRGVPLPANFENEFVPPGVLRDLASDLYDGEVAYVDDRVGAFLGELKARGLYDDAVVVLVSDHGEALWEHGLFGHGGNRLHDEVVRVPLIVKAGRGSFARGAVVPTQVRAFDVMPTLLELAGIPRSGELDAESLVALLAVDAPDVADRVAVTETSKNALALRTREWKYILRHARGVAEEARETLYHLTSDPGEQRNVAQEHGDVVERMRLTLLDHVLSHKPGTYAVAVGPDRAHRCSHQLSEVGAALSLVGIQPRQVEAGGVIFEGEASGALAFVAELESRRSSRDLARYRAGDLERLLRGGQQGLHLFAGPPATQREVPRSVDLQQLEAIRALGYVGEGGAPADDR